MNIRRNKGLKYGDYIIETISDLYAGKEEITASVETFYNCREMGYVLEVHDEFFHKAICIWICANRSSDKPMIVWEETTYPTETANMFTEDSYINRNKTFENIQEASVFVIDTIKEQFGL